jgi:hypothetical protein
MTREEVGESLEAALISDSSGRFFFACRKALVMIKIRGRPKPLLFHRRDKVAFQISAEALIIEKLQCLTTKKRLLWESVERFAAGEPETDNGSLFQG